MRRLLTTVSLSLTLLVFAVQPAGASGYDEPDSRPASLRLAKQWIRWAIGSNTNPFLNEDVCGEVVGRVFFVTAAIAPGTERTCRIPKGMPLLVSPGGTAFWASSDEQTDQDLVDLRDADFPFYTDERVTLDGVDLSIENTIRESNGAYRVRVRKHSFIRAVDPTFPSGWRSTRVASTGWFLLIAPPSRGSHTLELYDEYQGSPLDLTVHFRVRKC